MHKNIWYKFMLGVLVFQLMVFGPSPQLALAETSQANPTLIISAVQITGGPGHTHEDFIELYNPTDQPFDLSGYRLVKRTATGVTDTTIQSWSSSVVILPHHFFLWANTNYSGVAVAPDATSTATLADNNGIALRQGPNDSGVVVDSIAWGSTANIFTSVSLENPPANNSLIRDDLFAESASFSIGASNPRNSETESLPDPDPDPDPDPEDEEDEDEESDEPLEVDIKITELLPNPSGSDSGFEKIELFNAGEETVNLSGYRIDDASPSDPVSSNAHTFSSAEIESDSYYVLTIPVGKFSLNNTSGDVVTIFDDYGEVLDSVAYVDSSPEAKSYSYFASGWEWSEPTFGEENREPLTEEEEVSEESSEETEDFGQYDNSNLEISEVYPDPIKGGAEFVEIYNAGEEVAQLSLVTLVVGDKRKALPKFELNSREYFVIDQEELPAQLRNSGQTVKLEEDSTLISTVTYPTAVDGSSYSRFEDGFLWTINITSGKQNILQLPEVVKKEVAATAAKTSAVKATTTKSAAKTASKAVAAKATSKTPTSAAKADVAGLKVDSESSKNEAQDQSQDQATNTKQKDSMGKVIAMGAAAVVAGVIALYKLVFAAGIE